MSRFTAKPNTAAINEQIRAMWAEGLTYVAIANALGLTKNTVSGKISRMREAGVDLPARPSPIQERRVRPPRPGRSPERAIPAPAGPTLVPLVSVPAAPVVAPVAAPAGVRCGCRWALWRDDERPTQRFCDAPSMPGRSWCAAHHARVFVVRVQGTKEGTRADAA